MPTFNNGESAASVRTKINDAIEKVDGTQPISSVDINGGTIDGTVIGGSTPAAISGTTGTFSGQVRLNDTNHWIDNVGGSDISYRSGGTHNFYSGGFNQRLNIASNGDISFYEDTGTTPKFFWDASAEALGIGTTSISTGVGLEVISAGTRAAIVKRTATTPSNGTYTLEVDNSAQTGNITAAGALKVTNNNGSGMFIDGKGDVSLYDDSGAVKFFWDASAERLGIGTTAPNNTLHVKTSVDGGGVTLQRNSTTAGTFSQLSFLLSDADVGTPTAWIRGIRGSSVSLSDLVFGTSNTERLRITSTGNVGIGTSSPQNNLDVVGSTGIYQRHSTGGRLVFDDTDTADASTPMSYISNTAGALQFGRANRNASTGLTTSSVEAMRIDASGNVGIGTSSPSSLLNISAAAPVFRISNTGTTGDGLIHFGDSASNFSGVIQYNHTSNYMALFTSGLERARIDSSGNLLVGTTSAAQARADFRKTDNNAYTTSSSGNLLSLRNESTTAGTYSGLQFVAVGNGADVGTAHINAIQTASGSAALAFSTRNSATTAERMRITSTGDVLINRNVAPTSSTGTTGTLQLGFGGQVNARTTGSGLYLTDNLEFSGDPAATFSNANYISTTFASGYLQVSGTHRFYTVPSGTGGTPATASERLRIDSSGNFLVGTTTVPSNGSGGSAFTVETAGRRALRLSQTITENSALVVFDNPNGTVGTISTSGSSTLYNTSSDYRLKEDVQPMSGASDRVLALNPVNFAWKADGTRVDGFLAHEAQAVVPAAVTGEKDGEEMQAIDHSKLVPLLTAALQEALQKIEALEARITALEA